MEEDYSVITNQCGDDYLAVTSSPVTSDNLQSAINFSYQGFKFVKSVDDQAPVNMKLECSVIVCDANESDSKCAKGCERESGTFSLEEVANDFKSLYGDLEDVADDSFGLIYEA